MDASVHVCFVLDLLLGWLVIWVHPIRQDHYDPNKRVVMYLQSHNQLATSWRVGDSGSKENLHSY